MSKKSGAVNTAPVPRTSAGLRNSLFDVLDDLRAGRTSPRNAVAYAGVVNQIVGVTKLEMAYQRFIGTTNGKDGALEVPTLRLGE